VGSAMGSPWADGRRGAVASLVSDGQEQVDAANIYASAFMYATLRPTGRTLTWGVRWRARERPGLHRQ